MVRPQPVDCLANHRKPRYIAVMAATTAPRKPRKVTLSPQEENARQVLSLLMRMLGLSDAAVAEPLGKKYQAIQQRRRGETRIRIGDMAELADVLDVPKSLFEMDPMDAGAWLLSHRREQVTDASGWLGVFADPDRVLARTG